ncbi:putative eka-like protein [Erysiphe necator]|uniref:Putative eka-like protein n=1 Tax=Uncinula necator TaxID=52586 RepID=A0A0B1P1M4_UNCNE|nr:putative eka-like protein [Erysiphe necator]
MHSEDLCMAPTKCRNFGGPHRPDSRKCLARPTRNGAPTKEQLKIIRQAGDREFQAVLRAKAAEERASVLEGNSDEEPSQPEVVDMENTQASSVEDTAGDALRLRRTPHRVTFPLTLYLDSCQLMLEEGAQHRISL